MLQLTTELGIPLQASRKCRRCRCLSCTDEAGVELTLLEIAIVTEADFDNDEYDADGLDRFQRTPFCSRHRRLSKYPIKEGIRSTGKLERSSGVSLIRVKSVRSSTKGFNGRDFSGGALANKVQAVGKDLITMEHPHVR